MKNGTLLRTNQMQKINKIATVLFGLFLVLIAIMTFLDVRKFVEVESKLAIIYFCTGLLFTVRYFTSKRISIKDKVKLITVVSWALINGISYLNMTNIDLIIYIFLVSIFVLAIIEIISFIKNKFDLSKINLVKGACIATLGLGVLFNIMHWPGTGVLLFLELVALILLGTQYLKSLLLKL